MSDPPRPLVTLPTRYLQTYLRGRGSNTRPASPACEAPLSHLRDEQSAPGARGTNAAVATCRGDRPPFPPSPRAWPVSLGAADGPIGCALNILTAANPRRSTNLRSSHINAGPALIGRTRRICAVVEAGLGLGRLSLGNRTTPSPGVRVVAPCARRTALGSPPPKQPQAGTAWRSGRPAPGAGR